MKDLVPEPPRWVMGLLRSFCPQRLYEEIEGDLRQQFLRDQRLKGTGFAKRKLLWSTLRFFRPGILVRNKISIQNNHITMILNYFKIAWRSLAASKFFSLLTILGLTSGLVVGLLILIWVNDELSYDRFHKNGKDIYRVNVALESHGDPFVVQVVPQSVAYYSEKELTGIENIMRINDNYDYSVIRYGDIALKDNASVYTDPSAFIMFDYTFISGDRDRPFPTDNSVVITRSTAHKYFGNDDPMGKVLLADNKDNLIVTGVLEDFPDNSFLKCDILFPVEHLRNIYKKNGWNFEEQWGNYGWITFVQLKSGIDPTRFGKEVTKLAQHHQPDTKPSIIGTFLLQPLRNIHLYNPDGTPSAMTTVRIFSFVAFLILIIASINYVNLSTARAMLRSKEVSVRKIIGARRKQLFAQFTIQTTLFFIIALVLAVGIIILAMPVYNSLSGKHMSFDFTDLNLWLVMGGTLTFTLIASSIYPALLLSSFRPVDSLKGSVIPGFGNTAFRKVLVVVQFTFSAGLIMSTLIIGRQLGYIHSKELGYDKSHVFTLSMGKMEEHYHDIRSELLSQSGVVDVTSSSNSIVAVDGATLDIGWDGKNPDATFFTRTVGIDENFFSFFKLQLLQGAGFTGAGTDTLHFILNEAAVKAYGITDPVGKRFRLHRQEGIISGVVKDFHFTSLKNKIEPFLFYYSPSNTKLFIRTTTGDSRAAIRNIEKKWMSYNEGFVFDYSFMDVSYDNLYKSDERTGLLFNIFAGIAIVISCLGLLGLAAYTGQVKRKEIGIRKVLGASVYSISSMLSRDFLMLVLIAIAVATPVTWYLMEKWLSSYSYRAPVTVWVFALAGGVTILIALLTIGGQAIRAAMGNPVKALRSE